MCFGCEPLGGTDWGDIDVNSIEKAIHKALDLGINFFDTAGVYGLGLSEERLSKILGSKGLKSILQQRVAFHGKSPALAELIY